MKKFLALLLAVLMIASMSITAFAEDVADDVITSNTDQKKTGEVKVQVYDKSTGDPIESTGTYKVTVSWGNLLFKIQVNNASDVEWNGSAYTITNGSWDRTSTEVTVTNHSDMPVKVNGLFDNNLDTSETVEGVSATITGGLQNLDSAAGATAEDDLVAEYKVAITTAVPTSISVLEFTVDIIKLTIQTA